jgi:prepilin-type processing-associated H-X9-DG protein
MRAPFEGSLDAGFWGRYAGTQGYRHLGRTNVAYCDGSVQSLGDMHVETDAYGKTELERHNQTAEVKVGFLSSDNRAYDISKR